MGTRTVKGLVAFFLSLAVSSAFAAPTITRTNLYTDVFGTGGGTPAGTYLHLDSTVQSTGSSLTATATNVGWNVPLTFYGGGVFAPQNFDARIAVGFNPPTSGWTLTVIDSTGTVNGAFPTLADPEYLPLLLNLQIIANGDTPLIVWELPNLSGFDVDRIRVRINDVGLGASIYQTGDLAASTTSYQVAAGILQGGRTYQFRLLLEDLEGGALENRSNTFSARYSVPEPGTLALLGLGLAGLAGLRRRKQ